MSDLKNKVIKLAHDKPELRRHLLPLVKEASDALDPRKAILYFDLTMADYNIEEDAEDGDPVAQDLLANPHKALALEHEAMKEMSRVLGTRVNNEGHDSSGNLVCKVGISSPQDVAKIYQKLGRSFESYELDTPYMEAQGFTFYPQGVNGPSYSEDSRADGFLEDWVEDNT